MKTGCMYIRLYPKEVGSIKSRSAEVGKSATATKLWNTCALSGSCEERDREGWGERDVTTTVSCSCVEDAVGSD